MRGFEELLYIDSFQCFRFIVVLVAVMAAMMVVMMATIVVMVVVIFVVVVMMVVVVVGMVRYNAVSVMARTITENVLIRLDMY